MNYLKSAAYAAAAAILVGTIVEDLVTLGGGFWNDWQSALVAFKIIRFAKALP